MSVTACTTQVLCTAQLLSLPGCHCPHNKPLARQSTGRLVVETQIPAVEDLYFATMSHSELDSDVVELQSCAVSSRISRSSAKKVDFY